MAPHPLLTTAFGLLQRGDAAGAVAALTQVLAAEPKNATAHLYQGHALFRLNRKAEALKHVERACALQPQFADAFFNRGVMQAELGQTKDAEASFRQTLKIKPDYAAVYAHLGALLAGQERNDDAIAAFSALLKYQQDAQTYFNRGTVLLKIGKEAEAIADFEKAAALKPDYAPAQAALMNIYARLKRFDKAPTYADRAAVFLHKEPDIHITRGDILRAVGRFEEAIESYNIAITLRPDHGPSHVVRGDAYTSLKQLDKAVADYVKAASLQPYAHFAVGYAVQAAALICDWATVDTFLPVLREGVAVGREASTPFSMLACDVTAQEQLKCAEIMSRNVMAAVKKPLPPLRPTNSTKIRIGYFSPDFGAHAVSYLIAGVFEAHDRTQFEIIGFSYGPAAADDMYARIKDSFDQFIDVTAKSDREVAELARSHNIDIAVDLAGYTGRGRPGIFAHRAAPVQVNFLGYTGSSGAAFMDYVIVDDVVAPHADAFSEKRVFLPCTFLPSDPKRPREAAQSRAAYGLRDDQFVFCAFNNAYKINRATFKSWLNIVRRVPNSVLWLTDSNPWQVENLRQFAQGQGIDPVRLVFAKNLPSYAAHLARYGVADLFLDALPYNAHTTASDALWMGLPVLTCVGDTFAGRVAASLLTAIGLPELITRDRESFEDLAVNLAHDKAHLLQLRARIEANRDSAPAFDTPRYTRHLETAFATMMERTRAGLVAADVRVT